MAIEKIKILGALLELPANLIIGPDWPNWQCCLAGGSQRAPRILIFSIAMGADYTFYVKSIETHARAFLPLNISAIGSVHDDAISKKNIFFEKFDVNQKVWKLKIQIFKGFLP